jgi:hypothetical protein
MATDVNDNVVMMPGTVMFKSMTANTAGADAVFKPAGADADTIANLLVFCERMDEALRHTAAALLALDTRMRRLELAYNKAAREKAGALVDMRGERIIKP